MTKKHLIKKERWVAYLELWPFWGPPARPNSFDLKIWERYIDKLKKENKNVKALVLGATPEIRDLLAKYHIPTTVLDVNAGMVRGLGRLMKYKKRKKERIIINNWLNVSKLFPKNHFDLIMGHDVFNNLPWSFYSRLAQGIKKVLKKDGYFLLVSPITRLEDRISPREIVSLYKRKPQFFKSFTNRWWVMDVLKCWDYNKRTRQYFMAKIKKRLIKEIKKQGLPKKTIEDIWFFASSNVIDDYVGTHPLLKDVTNVFKKHFRIEKTFFNPLKGLKCHPNFVLRKK